jgi:hypothetical protein
MDIIREYEIQNFKMISFFGEISEEIRNLIVGSIHQNGILKLYLKQEPEENQEIAIVDFLNNHDPDSYADYRIIDLINGDFVTYPIENIDFVRHVKSGISLEKKVKMLNNGRPEKALYYYESELIAEIQFVFTTTPENLMIKREEVLYYYRKNDTKSNPILIKSKTFDLTDPYEGAKVLKERIDARVIIVENLKAFLSGVIMQATGQSLVPVINMIKPFWDECKTIREDFIELGVHDWKSYLLNIDISTTPYTFLAIPISQPAAPIYDEDGEVINQADVDKPLITVRDYLVNKINY